jgi:hypothetical protein
MRICTLDKIICLSAAKRTMHKHTKELSHLINRQAVQVPPLPITFHYFKDAVLMIKQPSRLETPASQV